jgi:hypothetical protein
MRKLIIISARLLASAPAQAQSLNIGSVPSENGISTGPGTDQRPDAGRPAERDAKYGVAWSSGRSPDDIEAEPAQKFFAGPSAPGILVRS